MLDQTTSLNMKSASNHVSNTALLFLEAWKHSVRLINIKYFGDGTEQGFETAQCIYDLRPNLKLIDEEIHSVEFEKRKFLIFFVSMYDPHAALDLLKACSLSLKDVTADLADNYQDEVQNLFTHYTEAGWW